MNILTLNNLKWNLYKMFCIWSSQGVLMASVDLKDAYYSVPINEEYQKYLKFLWEYPLKFIVICLIFFFSKI